MHDAQVTELSYQAPRRRSAAQAVYKAAIGCAQNPGLVEEWGKYLAETTTHEEIPSRRPWPSTR